MKIEDAILIMDGKTSKDYLYMYEPEDRPFLIEEAKCIAINILNEIQACTNVETVDEFKELLAGIKTNSKTSEQITVKYEKYYNDNRHLYDVKVFDSLEALADWMFSLVKGEYKKSMWFTDPEGRHEVNGKLHLDGSCIKSCDGEWTYWIEQIEKNGAIIYSTGKFTNGICYWNDEIKQWLKACKAKMNNPQFVFG